MRCGCDAVLLDEVGTVCPVVLFQRHAVPSDVSGQCWHVVKSSRQAIGRWLSWSGACRRPQPPHCLKKNCTPWSSTAVRIFSTHSSFIGRAWARTTTHDDPVNVGEVEFANIFEQWFQPTRKRMRASTLRLRGRGTPYLRSSTETPIQAFVGTAVGSEECRQAVGSFGQHLRKVCCGHLLITSKTWAMYASSTPCGRGRTSS